MKTKDNIVPKVGDTLYLATIAYETEVAEITVKSIIDNDAGLISAYSERQGCGSCFINQYYASKANALTASINNYNQVAEAQDKALRETRKTLRKLVKQLANI